MNAKQSRFVEEYLVDLNAKQAAIRAGYSAKSAEVQGCKLLRVPKVKAAVDERTLARAEKVGVDQEWVLQRLMRIAGIDPRKHMTWGTDGVSLRASADLTDDEAYAVAEVSETTTKDGGSLKLKVHDKVRALELLGKHLGMFVEKHEHTGKNGEPIAMTLDAAREIVRASRGSG